MIKFDDVTNENTKKIKFATYFRLSIQNINNWRFSIWENKFINLINQLPDIDKIYLYAKNPYEEKYQFLINKKESTVLRPVNNSKAFIEYSNDMDDIYKNIE